MVCCCIFWAYREQKRMQYRMNNMHIELSRGDKVKVDKSAGNGLGSCKNERQVDGLEGVVVRWSHLHPLKMVVKLDKGGQKVRVPVDWLVPLEPTQRQKMLQTNADMYKQMIPGNVMMAPGAMHHPMNQMHPMQASAMQGMNAGMPAGPVAYGGSNFS